MGPVMNPNIVKKVKQTKITNQTRPKGIGKDAKKKGPKKIKIKISEKLE